MTLYRNDDDDDDSACSSEKKWNKNRWLLKNVSSVFEYYVFFALCLLQSNFGELMHFRLYAPNSLLLVQRCSVSQCSTSLFFCYYCTYTRRCLKDSLSSHRKYNKSYCTHFIRVCMSYIRLHCAIFRWETERKCTAVKLNQFRYFKYGYNFINSTWNNNFHSFISLSLSLFFDELYHTIIFNQVLEFSFRIQLLICFTMSYWLWYDYKIEFQQRMTIGFSTFPFLQQKNSHPLDQSGSFLKIFSNQNVFFCVRSSNWIELKSFIFLTILFVFVIHPLQTWN